MDQRYAIQFCVKLNKIFFRDLGPSQAGLRGSRVMSRARIHFWHRAFKDGRDDVEDEQRSGRPSTSQTDQDVDTVHKLFEIDRRASLREMCEDLKIPLSLYLTVCDVEGLPQRYSPVMSSQPSLNALCQKCIRALDII